MAASPSRSVRSFITSRSWLRPLFKTINSVRCRIWDELHGVDTCGEIALTSLDFQSLNKTQGLLYESHHPRVTRIALMALDIEHENYTFIDFGCGKGRVLLLASEFPFRRVLGLEFAPPLAETAEQNLRSYRSKTQRCHNISVRCMDVTDFQLPPEPEVLYFYNPFKDPVMQRVAQEIEWSMQRSPRDLLVLSTGQTAARDRAFGARRQFERLRRERYFDIYRHRA